MATSKLKRLTLADLLNGANRHYSEHYLSRYFDVASGSPKSGAGDTLAKFIVSELSEGFDSLYHRERQVATALRALERAKDDLQRAIDGLREL